MAAPKRINSEFEGKTLTTFTHQDRPCWIARDIGRVLTYSRDGRRLVSKILGSWAGELIEGYDYAVLRGNELDEFKVSMLIEATSATRSRFERRLVLLFEPGLHLVLNRTFKRTAMRLRRFLMDEVLPRMHGKNRPWPGQPPANTFFVPGKGRALDRHALREHRLLAQHELSRRVFQSESLRRTVQTLAHLGRISDDQAQTYEVLAAEIALGIELPGLRIGSPFDEVAILERRRALDGVVQKFRRQERIRELEEELGYVAPAPAQSEAADDGGIWPQPDSDGDDWPPADDEDEPSREASDPDLDSSDE